MSFSEKMYSVGVFPVLFMRVWSFEDESTEEPTVTDFILRKKRDEIKGKIKLWYTTKEQQDRETLKKDGGDKCSLSRCLIRGMNIMNQDR